MNYKRTRVLALLLALFLLVGDLGLVANGTGFIRLITPSEYFGVAEKTYEDENVRIYTYSDHKTYPREKIAEYVKDMKEKGLQLRNQSTVAGTDICTRLEWMGENCITLWWKGKTGCLDVWVFSPVILIGNTTSSEIAAAKRKVRIFSPEKYFGTVSKVKTGKGETAYYFEGYESYPEDAVEKCLRDLWLLGFSGGSVSDQRNGDKQIALFKGNSRQIWIRWYKEDACLVFRVSDTIAVDGFDEPVQETAPTVTEPETTEGETVPAETYPCVLCSGSGSCKSCDGTGLRKSYGSARSNLQQTCYVCRGSGICHSCGGNCWQYK